MWARENDVIPWRWVVDETREAEYQGTWEDPKSFAEAMLRDFRRDRWQYQQARVEVWSEKGTVRGTLAPVLYEYGVTLRVFHGYSSATSVREIAMEHQSVEKPPIAIYVGDYDPSGLHMSEVDLPKRLSAYGAVVMNGHDGYTGASPNICLLRVALEREDCNELPSFDVETKKGDPRFWWFRDFTGSNDCWELDAMDPNDLRDRVEATIQSRIDEVAWERTGLVEAAEQASLREILGQWPGSISGRVER